MNMLWYKSWLETRWRFSIGLALLTMSAASGVYLWPMTQKLVPLADGVQLPGVLGQKLQEAVEVQRTFRGFIWHQEFSQNLLNLVTLFAILLGIGSLLRPGSRSATFTLALPASRRAIVGIRAATGLAELLVLSMAPALAVTWVAPAVGESYPVPDALVHGLCLFVEGTLFYGLAAMFSTIFGDFWRPLGLAVGAACLLGALELFSGGRLGYGVFRMMSGAAWFQTRDIPWPGLLASLAAGGGLLWCAAINTVRRDF